MYILISTLLYVSKSATTTTTTTTPPPPPTAPTTTTTTPTPPRLFDHESYASLSSVLLGQSDVSLKEMVTSDHDLATAIKKYKFALLPKVQSELDALVPVLLMGADEAGYRQWTQRIGTYIYIYIHIYTYYIYLLLMI
jgi:hypothetical protein